MDQEARAGRASLGVPEERRSGLHHSPPLSSAADSVIAKAEGTVSVSPWGAMRPPPGRRTCREGSVRSEVGVETVIRPRRARRAALRRWAAQVAGQRHGGGIDRVDPSRSPPPARHPRSRIFSWNLASEADGCRLGAPQRGAAAGDRKDLAYPRDPTTRTIRATISSTSVNPCSSGQLPERCLVILPIPLARALRPRRSRTSRSAASVPYLSVG